jgi:hypothetical protein
MQQQTSQYYIQALGCLILLCLINCGGQSNVTNDARAIDQFNYEYIEGHQGTEVPYRPDLFVFLDGKNRDVAPASLIVDVVAASIENSSYEPDGFGPGNSSPIYCYIDLRITNNGSSHAAGVTLDSITIEATSGSTQQLTASVKSVPYFDGVVRSGQTASPRFQCAALPWTTKIPFACFSMVKLRSNIVYFSGSPIPLATQSLKLDCPG